MGIREGPHNEKLSKSHVEGSICGPVQRTLSDGVVQAVPETPYIWRHGNAGG